VGHRADIGTQRAFCLTMITTVRQQLPSPSAGSLHYDTLDVGAGFAGSVIA
jgi:hypothetical protein